MKHEYENVIMDPASYFTIPSDILSANDFDKKQKKKILQAWQLDITLLHVCDAENMSNNQEITMLSRINQALTSLSNPNDSSCHH